VRDLADAIHENPLKRKSPPRSPQEMKLLHDPSETGVADGHLPIPHASGITCRKVASDTKLCSVKLQAQKLKRRSIFSTTHMKFRCYRKKSCSQVSINKHAEAPKHPSLASEILFLFRTKSDATASHRVRIILGVQHKIGTIDLESP